MPGQAPALTRKLCDCQESRAELNQLHACRSGRVCGNELIPQCRYNSRVVVSPVCPDHNSGRLFRERQGDLGMRNQLEEALEAAGSQGGTNRGS